MTLAGQRVVVTRAPHQSGQFEALLQAAGAIVVPLPVIRIEPLDPTLLFEALRKPYDALIFGSQNAVALVAQWAHAEGIRLSGPVACVGAKTAQAVAETPLFTGPRWVPPTFRAEALVATIIEQMGELAGRRFVFPRAPEGREVISTLLTQAGAQVDTISVYRILPAALDLEAIARARDADWFTFLSGETLAAFVQGVPDARSLLKSKRVAVIGPVAAEKAAALGIRVDLVPQEATVAGLVACLDLPSPR